MANNLSDDKMCRVFELLWQGKSIREVAAEVGVAKKTVNSYRKIIYESCDFNPDELPPTRKGGYHDHKARRKPPIPANPVHIKLGDLAIDCDTLDEAIELLRKMKDQNLIETQRKEQKPCQANNH